MGVNEDVKQHMEFMNHEKKLAFCLVYLMQRGLKCVFLNTSSLHKHFDNVANNHILHSNICMLAENRLKQSDPLSPYLICGFQRPFHNDDTYTGDSRLFHGLIIYISHQ